MKIDFQWMRVSGLGLVLIMAIGCSNPVLDTGRIGADGKQSLVSAKVGDQLTAANFGNGKFSNSILENDKTVIVDFSATWCGPCKMLKPILEELEEQGLADVVVIDTDQNPEIARAFGVQGIPHLLFIKDGKLLQTATGFKDKEELVSIIEKMSP